MDVVLGAWGLGSFLASISDHDIWRLLFGKYPNILTLPPLSSLHSGKIEPFPFLLANKVYIDTKQYESLRYPSNVEKIAFVDSEFFPNFLCEFERLGILKPIDFRSLIKSHKLQLLVLVEKILNSPELPQAAAQSRRLWLDFLLSPGAVHFPFKEKDIKVTSSSLDIKDYLGRFSTQSLNIIHPLLPKDHIPVAAIKCGHDIFDVVTMLAIGEQLGATICDWQMYDPLYQLAIKVAHFEFKVVQNGSTSSDNLKWYIPVPKSLDINEIWRLRDDPHLTALRNQPLVTQMSELAHSSDPNELRKLRKSLQERLNQTIINTYNAHYSDSYQPVVIENLDCFEGSEKRINQNKLEVIIKQLEFVMGDKGDIYNIGQAGAAGRYARSDKNTFLQSEDKKTLAEAAEEIQQVLKYLEDTNPSATEAEKIDYINDETTPSFKRRVAGALQASGEAAIDEFILENKYLKVAKAAFKGWLQPDGEIY